MERMINEAEVSKQVSPEMEGTATQRARDRARAARWDLDTAIFLFVILIIIIILLFQGIGFEIVALIAIFGLAMVWLVGWRRARQLYQRFYDEELIKLEYELRMQSKVITEESLEEIIQKALRER